ncbi:biotin transporter BioY [Tardiphaga alba]|uniref:Biotin transporter n=1 Tax=Tardiphaga alba TaxID=340268 RepID=A0ABX8A872_9BRAD|nr:biotin transporter BioY [Tardiphaga alba]QUS39834.1 biotin transporter BioY [Tardiphaga alba]
MVRSPIAGVLWPASGTRTSVVRRAAILAVAGVVLLAISAKVNLPLPYVPMTLQTLVVLMIGAAYGWRLGTATIVLYLVAGGCGLPVFAGPTGGLKPLFGPTAGFLFGFVVAAFLTGWLAERGWDRSVGWLFVAMGIGHVIILSMGWGWLALGVGLGPAKALIVGVTPFLAGALLKNAIGALLIPLAHGAAARRNN